MDNVEVWKVILAHPKYEVSDQGRVRNKETGYIRSLRADRYGHLRVTLGRDVVKVHKLVAEAFVPYTHTPFCRDVYPVYPPLCWCEPQCIRHRNDDKNDNRAVNLVWGTYSENLIDSYKNGRRTSRKHGTSGDQ